MFPASFVRVVDAFPGDGPAGGDCSSYLGADLHSGHEYDNTRPVWGGLDSGLRAAFGGAGPGTGPLLGARLASQLGEKTRSVYCSVYITVQTDLWLQLHRAGLAGLRGRLPRHGAGDECRTAPVARRGQCRTAGLHWPALGCTDLQ